MSDPLKDSAFCIYPFVSLVTRTNGDVAVCCRSEPVGNIQQDSMSDIWNNEKMCQLRADVVKGVRSEICAGCWRYEDKGMESKRLRQNDLTNPESTYSKFGKFFYDGIEPGFKMKSFVKILELKTSNLCNFKCRMCNPIVSTSWNDYDAVAPIVNKRDRSVSTYIKLNNLDRKPLQDFFTDNPKFWTDMNRLCHSVDQLEFSGGEPLMNPFHYEVLDYLIRMRASKHINLKYDTNMSVLGFKGMKLENVWRNFKSVTLNVTVDGNEEVHEYIRTNANYDSMLANINKVIGLPNLERIVIATAVQNYNALVLPQITRYAASIGAPHHMCFVMFPEVLSIEVVLPEVRVELINRYERFLEEIPTLYENQDFAKYTIARYKDAISYLRKEVDPLKVSKLYADFVEYDKCLNEARGNPFQPRTVRRLFHAD